LGETNTIMSQPVIEDSGASYIWRSEESALISAILGTAEHRELEEESLERWMEPVQDALEKSLLPEPPKSATQTDIYHLDRMVVMLTEELRLHRRAIQELHALVRQAKADLLPSLSPSQRHREPWWRRWLTESP
jgi:hypothetical protein